MKRNRAVPRQFSLFIVAGIFLVTVLATRQADWGWWGISMPSYKSNPRNKSVQQPTTGGQQSRTREQQPQPDLRVSVRLVNVFTTVTDSHGAPVANLQKDDFKVLEDGILQSVRVFDREFELPLSIVMEVDTSPSTERDFKLEVTSARGLPARLCVRGTGWRSTRYGARGAGHAFHPDLRRIERGIDSLRVGPGTSIYDAIFLGSEALIGPGRAQSSSADHRRW